MQSHAYQAACMTPDPVLNVHRLRVFRAVAERRSFTRAAEDLFMTQPAVSHLVALLESSLGTRLLRRQARGVVLTEAGEVVYRYALGVLDATDGLVHTLSQLAGSAHGRLAVGAGMTLGIYHLPPLLGEFQRAHQSVEVSLRIGRPEDLVEPLLSNSIDLLFADHIPKAVQAAELVAEQYFVDEMVLVVAPSHPFAGRRGVSLADVAEQPFVMRESGASIRRWVDAHLARLDIRPRVVLELGHTEAIKRAVQASFGVAFLSREAIEQERDAGWLVVVDVASPPLLRPVYAMHSSSAGLRSTASRFLDLARAKREPATGLTLATPGRSKVPTDPGTFEQPNR